MIRFDGFDDLKDGRVKKSSSDQHAGWPFENRTAFLVEGKKEAVGVLEVYTQACRGEQFPRHGIKRANAAISYWHGRGMLSGRSLIKPITS